MHFVLTELRMEIDRLRSQTGLVSEDVIGASLAEIHCLRQQLMKKEKEMDEMTKWVVGDVELGWSLKNFQSAMISSKMSSAILNNAILIW